jgi:hypothetical protein
MATERPCTKWWKYQLGCWFTLAIEEGRRRVHLFLALNPFSTTLSPK